MSKIFCGLVVNVLLVTLLAFCFNDAVAEVVAKALDFTGSNVVLALVVLVGIFCWGEVTRED